MNSPPVSNEDALELLLEHCPEFRVAWQESAQTGTDDDGSISIYWVFASVILPFLDYALIRNGVSAEHEGFDHYERHARYMQNLFASSSRWRDIPNRGTRELEYMIDRLYEVLELWAASAIQQIRDATFIEIAESGISDLTVEDLTKRGGPYLRSLYLDYEGGLRSSIPNSED